MSPTMTEGGITSWKKEEGESFVAGDVLLEVVRDIPDTTHIYSSHGAAQSPSLLPTLALPQ